MLQTLQRQTPPPPQQKETPVIEDDLHVLTYLRGQIMNEVLRLSTSIEADAQFTTPQQRITLLTQLVDRLLKLNTHLHTHPRAYEDEEIEMEHSIQKLSDEEYDAKYGTQEDHLRRYHESIES